MTLPVRQKKRPRPISVTVRISEETAINLRLMAETNNLSLADVIEFLIDSEYLRFEKRKK